LQASPLTDDRYDVRYVIRAVMPAQREHEIDLRVSLVRATLELPYQLGGVYKLEIPFRAVLVVVHVDLWRKVAGLRQEQDKRAVQRARESYCRKLELITRNSIS